MKKIRPIHYLKTKRADFAWYLLGKRIWEKPILSRLWKWSAYGDGTGRDTK